MMSSAIPARLEFQCGHAALVSLPRIKGETSAQRNDRVAREKTSAQARSCDFCAPQLEIVVHADTAPEIIASAPATSTTEAVVRSVAAPAISTAEPVANGVAAPAISTAEPVANGVAAHADEAKPAKRRRRRVAAEPQQFTIHFRVERVIAAKDINDAVRQAQAQALPDYELVGLVRARD